MNRTFITFWLTLTSMLVPWPPFEASNWPFLVAGTGCFIAIPVIYLEITWRGLRHPAT